MSTPTISNVLSYANSKIEGNGNITDTAGLLFANDGMQDFRLEMINHGVEASQIQEAYRDASVPTGGLPSTFLYPTDMLALKILTVNYTDTTTQNYVEPTQVDIGNTSGNKSFEWLRINQDIQNPQFDDRGDWYELFPTFTSGMNILRAIRMFYYLIPTPYASVSDTLQYPESLDQYCLGDKIVQLYYESVKDWDGAAIYEKKYEKRRNRLINTLVRGEDKPIAPQGLPLSGWEF